jgi:hypothetical protein
LTRPIQDSSAVNDDSRVNNDISSSLPRNPVERIITPIQTPASNGTSGQAQAMGNGYDATSQGANATFAVLKATALQQAFGHPMAYARILMQA